METVQFFFSVDQSDGPTAVLKIARQGRHIRSTSGPPVSAEPNACHLSFILSEGSDTLEWLQKNISTCFVYTNNKADRRHEISEDIQLLVKRLTELWMQTVPKKQGKFVTLPQAQNNSLFTSSSRTSVDHTQSARRASVSGGRRTSVSSVSGSRRASISGISGIYGARRASRYETERYFLDVVSIKAETFSKISSVGVDALLIRDNSPLQYFLEHLSTLEWLRIRDEKEEEEVIVTVPVRPSVDYSITGRPSVADIAEPGRQSPAATIIANDELVVEEITEEKKALKEPWHKRLSFWKKKQPAILEQKIITVAADAPAVLLPSPPRDDEKYIYVQTRRLYLYGFGTFSFLSVSAGMWLFAISTNHFYWFGVFVGLIQIYLIISYTVGYCGRDFNLDDHKKGIAEYAITENYPSVDVYLPCCKEPLEILENTYKYVSKLDYPNLKVFVLDDGGLDSVKRLAEQYGFNYITRDNKPYLKKAGNLRYAFARTTGDFFIIYDADFCPRSDFLKETLPWMYKDKKIAILQSPQFFRPSKMQTWVEQGASSTQELFYRVVQVNRDRWQAPICVGSNAVYRREALEPVGGTAEIGHSEDVHTGFYATIRGWKVKYIPLALACGVSPDTPQSFFSQQMRWCSGSTTLLSNPEFWRSPLRIIQKICFLSGMMYYSAAALSIFLIPLPGLLITWLNPELVKWYNFVYAFPSIIYSVIIARLWSRQMYNFNVNFVFVIQQYAYFMAIKDRIFGTTASWVPSGDNQGHGGKKKKKGTSKYLQMRIVCLVWVHGTVAGIVAGVTVRLIQGYPWYHFFPLLVLEVFNYFIAHKFMFFNR